MRWTVKPATAHPAIIAAIGCAELLGSAATTAPMTPPAANWIVPRTAEAAPALAPYGASARAVELGLMKPRLAMNTKSGASRPGRPPRGMIAAASTSTAATYSTERCLMLRLYDYLPSQNAYKVRMLLGHLGLAYETVPVAIFDGESRTPAFLKMNPAGAVPVLEIGPGRFIAESNAILCYLAEGTAHLPSDRFDRAKVLRWLFFEQDYVQPSIATIRHWTMTGKLERNAAQVAGRRAAGERVLDLLDRHLQDREFLADSGYSIADVAVFAYVHRAEEGGFDLAARPALRGWIGRVAAQSDPLPPVHPYSIDPHSHRSLPVEPSAPAA
jgi:glutathione S-transferase